ncbi:MAG: DUF2188 domain-containing protein [bacterium]
MGKRYHIVPHENDWQVKGENSEKAIKTFGNKSEALYAGKQIAINQQAELIIHGRDGKIQNSNSYGNDPFPPRDMKH